MIKLEYQITQEHNKFLNRKCFRFLKNQVDLLNNCDFNLQDTYFRLNEYQDYIQPFKSIKAETEDD